MDRIPHYCLSGHAEVMRKERAILSEWIDITIKEPNLTELREDGTMHYIRSIPEKGGRFLRVVVNTSLEPPRIITLFFDRRIQI